jgi:hypothetical protein
MKIAVVLVRHRRLLALCGLSLLLHLLVLDWIARANRAASQRLGEPAPLALHLARAPKAQPAPQDPPEAAHSAAAPLRTDAAPAPTSAPSGSAATAGASPALATQEAAPALADAGSPLVQMPGRYRVRMPPPAVLVYSLTRTRAGRAEEAAGGAQIVWQHDENRYRMQADGVTGSLSSEGASGDAGIAPATGSERRADGTLATTVFDDEGKRIAFSATPATYPINVGSQDRASVLMQLAGIGLAESDQVKDVIEIYVGTANDARIERYQVMGQETIDSPLGRLAAWRLVQLARPGEPRLELWLAPEKNWYPVMLRTTALDGTVTTQTLARIDPAPPLP